MVPYDAEPCLSDGVVAVVVVINVIVVLVLLQTEAHPVASEPKPARTDAIGAGDRSYRTPSVLF